MEKKELLVAVMNLHTAVDEIRYQMCKPFEMDGYVYATDGRSVVRVPADQLADSYKQEYKCPNASALFKKPELTPGSISSMRIIESDGNVKFGQWVFSESQWNRVCKTTAILGLEGWIVGGWSEHASAMYLRNGDVEMLVMPTAVDEFSTEIVCDNIVWNEGIDEKSGTIALEAIRKKEKEEEAAHIAKVGEKYDNIYSVTIAKYATMYVEASDAKEARKIAREHMDDIDDWDFDDAEIDSMDTTPSCAENYMDTIYTDDGEYSYDEYAALAD